MWEKPWLHSLWGESGSKALRVQSSGSWMKEGLKEAHVGKL